MSKNEIVTIEGFTNEVKQGKFGEFVSVGVTDRKFNEQTKTWENGDKTYYTVALEPGHGITPNSLYKVTGQLKLGAYLDKNGDARVSAWITKAQFERIAAGTRTKAELPADLIEDVLGATPF